MEYIKKFTLFIVTFFKTIFAYIWARRTETSTMVGGIILLIIVAISFTYPAFLIGRIWDMLVFSAGAATYAIVMPGSQKGS